MLTRGVCLVSPGIFGVALADVTLPRAIRPCPPSFSLANTKMVSPSAICLPPYIVFCAVNVNALARGASISALIANAMIRSPDVLSGLCHRQPLAAAHQQHQHDHDIEQVPGKAVGKGCRVGARPVEDNAGDPPAERHADDGRGDDDADAG